MYLPSRARRQSDNKDLELYLDRYERFKHDSKTFEKFNSRLSNKCQTIDGLGVNVKINI